MGPVATESPTAPELGVLVEDVSRALGLPPPRVRGAAELLADGATIPFIARYRKERTGGLDEKALRAVEDSLEYFRALRERKETILRTLRELGKLDEALHRKILATSDRKDLEDLYLPFKPKRRTRAQLARERGLGPLAAYLAAQTDRQGSREEILRAFVDPSRGVEDAEAALRGALDIVAEEWADDPGIRGWLSPEVQAGAARSAVKKDWKGKPSKFEMYYDFREPLARIPSHRYLAMRRGEAEGVLGLSVVVV